ncbi:MAG: phenylpropionate dioxygenase-like ring-hydroxylating dioxygenase large terminal subunit [Planctomycetota bacterium]|jgi:phenylpropionate dioxygenase-like ring-hydroxylating dioxygenase large terminal subunit
MSSPASPTANAYQGYQSRQRGDSDELLVRTGPGTACGEYLRRYWQPVALTAEVKDVPQLVNILGEELVLFCDRSGNYGLVHKQCPHRRASMEFGVCEDRGIRCCYHGWLFDIDGSILEVPGQPQKIAELVKQQTSLGAYPVKEYRGIIFTYLGPMDKKPEFPVYDTLEIAGQTLVPYRADYRCNWIQVLDAILDPIHTSFLHSRMSRAQFSEGLGELGELLFYQREMSFLGANVRRVDEHVWVRINELVLPNYTQAGSAFSADGTRSIHYGRTAFARWVVPTDDENSTAFAWAIFGDRADPESYNTPEGPELIEQGELMDRPYEQRQRFPGDAEAVEGMGRIADQKMEHLVPSDKGIIQYRKCIRKLCRALEKGIEPEHVTEHWQNPIPTYGGDTVLRIPDDPHNSSQQLIDVGETVMKIQFDAEALQGDQRDQIIIDALVAVEAGYQK